MNERGAPETSSLDSSILSSTVTDLQERAYFFPEPSPTVKRGQMKTLDSSKYQVAPVRAGYTDRILQLDLSSLTTSTTEVDPDFRRKYIGGRGYAMKMIWDGTTEETRYDSPENILVMASGPLVIRRGSHCNAGVERFIDRGFNVRIRMTEQACRILTDKVYVAMIVEVGYFGTFAGHHRQREGLKVQN